MSTEQGPPPAAIAAPRGHALSAHWDWGTEAAV
jgi:hypothetical protein